MKKHKRNRHPEDLYFERAFAIQDRILVLIIAARLLASPAEVAPNCEQLRELGAIEFIQAERAVAPNHGQGVSR
jgi:hypothetical protein